MGLIKLLAYSLLGYVLYELFLGLSEGPQLAVQRSGGKDSKPIGPAGDARTIDVSDPNGAHTRRTVGRGVIQ
jgi:hypothetical protein